MSKIDTEANAAKKVDTPDSLDAWVAKRTAGWKTPVTLAALSTERQALWANRRVTPLPAWRREVLK